MANSVPPADADNKERGSILHSPLLRRALVFTAIFHFVAILGYSLPVRLLRTDQNRDLVVYYKVIERMHNNEPVYLDLSGKGSDNLAPPFPAYLYPPTLSSILAMTPAMGFVTFARIWTLLLYVAFWIYAICLAKIAVRRVTVTGTLVAGLALTFFPGTHFALSLGNIDPFLWVLFGIALAVPTVRGAGLMAVTFIKPWAMWPFLWSLRDGWRVIAGALVVSVGSLVLGVLARGAVGFYAECITWVRDVLPLLGQGSWSAGNWSVSFGVLRAIRWIGFWDYADGPLPLSARLWLLLCGIAVPILAGFLLRKKPKTLQLSAVGCSAVVFAPLCWINYLPVLLTVLSALVGQKTMSNQKPALGVSR